MKETQSLFQDEQELELENRMKNLLWTVSGDYQLQVKLDLDSFRKSRYISIYDAIKQGAFAKYFDKDALGMYLVKKLYFGADEPSLVGIAQLAVDCASYLRMAEERKGILEIRKKAFADMLEYDFGKMSASIVGRIKIQLLREGISGKRRTEQQMEAVLERLRALSEAKTTYEILEAVDWIYNEVIDRSFEKKYGNLQQVLAVTLEELKEFDWQDFLDEDLYEESMEQYMKRAAQAVTTMQELQKEAEKPRRQGMSTVILDEEAIAKMYSYMELNYGRSYLSEQEQRRLNYEICRGPHADCSLYFTDGILSNMVRKNYQSEYARRAKEDNLRTYGQHYHMSKRNIEILTDSLRRSLLIRNERETVSASYGTIVPGKLWQVGNVREPKIFQREIRRDNRDFVVDVLIDASGSQRSRQSLVAIQGYILSEALSNAGIPHRVMGFCTFWDYTVMRRFREYDEGREANKRIFEFHASSNNRDGLAIRAAAHGLLKREEEHKVLIVLSDGRPNDITLNRPNSRNPEPYFGDYAVKDTAQEVRRLRSQGMSVLGVFAGEEQDLAAEQKIFGRDFAYIRNISNFSNVVGLYLKKQLDE